MTVLFAYKQSVTFFLISFFVVCTLFLQAPGWGDDGADGADAEHKPYSNVPVGGWDDAMVPQRE